MANALKDKWNSFEPETRRKLLFAGIAAGAVGFVLIAGPSADKKVAQEEKERQIQTTQLVTGTPPEPTIDDLRAENAALQQAMTSDFNKQQKELTDAKVAAQQTQEEAARQLQQQNSDLATQLDTMQQELRLLKMSNGRTSESNNIALPPLPELGDSTLPDLPGSPSGSDTITKPSKPVNTLTYIRKEENANGNLSSVSNELLKPVPAASEAPAFANYLTTGSIIEGVLLNGMDAPAELQGQKNPVPTTIRVKAEAILPNRYRQDIRECFITASGFGELSTERARLRTERIACISKDGKVMDSKLSGYVIGEDGKVGVRGRVVTKQGALIGKTILASFMAQLGEGLAPSPVTSLNLSGSGTTQFQHPNLKDLATSGGYRGAANAMNEVAQFYLDLAKQMFPVIEIDAGRHVSIILIEGVGLSS